MNLHTATQSFGASKKGVPTVAIIGGGPAGLTAAYELHKHSDSHHPVVFEESDQVGGISRTEVYKGYRYDIGGHRFFTKVKSVEALWKEVLPNDFLQRPRMSRIFYRSKYYDYPLKPVNALLNMGPYESIRIMLSYAKWKVRPSRTEETFEQWVINRFGGRLFWHFFKSYTEKVWGIPCNEIRADWAAQRIKNLSLMKAVWNALTGSNDTHSLIEKFDYPRLGPGMMWEAFRDRVEEKGGEVRMEQKVRRIFREGNKVRAVEVENADGSTYEFEADEFISSMPISALVENMVPPAPDHVVEAARKLRYRDFLMVTLIIEGENMFPDNWIYIHSPDVKVGRIQNFRSWSEEMIPEENRSSLGMEYFCNENDELWDKDDKELLAQAERELRTLNLVGEAPVLDGKVIRQRKAYPLYDSDYRDALETIREWLATISNLQAVGRNGMHRYNNQDHSMLTAMLAVKNILGEKHDLWAVNVEEEYHEEVSEPEPEGAKQVMGHSERLQPTRILEGTK